MFVFGINLIEYNSDLSNWEAEIIISILKLKVKKNLNKN
jgi:hypothetical protein